MTDQLQQPVPQAIFYEDSELYACLASEAITVGHCIVVWKDPVRDVDRLDTQEYRHLMDSVQMVRRALMKTLNLEKVYLIYMDEICHVHWHLIPRYEQKGVDVFIRPHTHVENFDLALEIANTINLGVY